jgi:Tfp pilus assembly protein PilF
MPFKMRVQPGMRSISTDMWEGSDSVAAKRRMMLRDATSILIVVVSTIALFGVTLFLFRSFSVHRAALAQRWSDRGRHALAANKPDEAITALRTALSYAPGTRDYELLLASALGRAGYNDESYTYFLGLWDATPGDGNINLALARLAAQKGSSAEAINHYRAAIFGTWQGDGVQRRAEVRAELARYLIEQHDLESARGELLIAGGNTPDSYERDLTLAHLFEQAQDSKDAELYYQKAIALRPGAADVLEAAGRLAYRMNDYAATERLLRRAADERTSQHSPEAAADSELAGDARRLLELRPATNLAPRERVARIQTIWSAAKKRLSACSAPVANVVAVTAPQPALQELVARWARPDATAKTSALLRDPARQEAVLQLAYDTERRLQPICGPATGDDALILRLANGAASPTGREAQ